MNNIYKVIWSKAKNCYVVASEIARSHTKSATGSEKIGGVTRRSLLASLMALSLLCGGLGVAGATLEVLNQSGTTGAVKIYTKEEVDNALKEKGLATDVATNKANIEKLQEDVGNATSGLTQKVTEQGEKIATNKANIDTNTAAINSLKNELNSKADEGTVTTALDTKANKADVYSRTVADDKFATKEALNDLTTVVNGKADAADVTNKLAQKADLTALEGKADKTYVDQKLTEAGNNVETKLANYATTAYVDSKIADEENARENAITAAIAQERNDRDAAIKLEATNRDAAITKAKTELQDKVKAEETVRKEEDAKLEEKITENTTAINNEKAAREAADADLSKCIGTVDADGEYIKKSGTNNVSENLKALDNQAKKNADAIAAEATERTNKDTELEGKIKKNSEDITTLQGDVTAAQGDIAGLKAKDMELEGKIKNNADNIQKNKEDIAVIDKRTAGIDRIDARHETTIEGHVTVDDHGNVTADGKLTGDGVDAGDGAITTKGAVNAGSLNVTDASTLKGDVTMEKTLKVTGDTTLQKTNVNDALNVTGASDLKGNVTLGTPNGTNTVTVNGTAKFNAPVNMANGLNVTNGGTKLKNTTVEGNLNVTGTINTDKMVFGDPATGNYTEINKGNITSKNAAVAGDATLKSSSMELDHSKLEVAVADKDSNGHLTMTADQTSIKNSDLAGKNYSEIVADKDSVKTTVKDEKGNTTSTKSSATEIRNYASDAAGNKTNNVQTATQNKSWAKDKDGNESSIVQTGKDITNTAQNGTITNDAQNIVNNATGDMKNTVGGKLTTTVTGQATEDFNGGLDTNVKGTENHTVTGDQNIHVTGKQTNKIDGNQENTIGGNQTTTVTGNISNKAENITNEAKTKLTDTAGDSTVTTENGKGTTFTKTGSTVYSTAAGAPTDTNIAGNHITTGRVDANELGVSDKDGDNSADLSVKAGKGVKASASDGATTGSLDVTADEVGSSVKDADGKGSTFKQRIDAIMGNVKTDTGESDVTQKGDEITSKVGIGEATNSRVTQKKGSLEAAVTDGTNTNVSYDTANASAKLLTDGTKVNKQQDNLNSSEKTITNGTYKTSTMQSALDITHTAKDGTITHDAKDIVNNASNSITDKVGTNTRVLDNEGITDTVGGSTFKQRIDKIMMESKDVSIKAEETLTNEAKVITNKASEVINNEAIDINNTATGIINSKASEIKNQADKLISNKVGENTSEYMEDGKITTSVKDGAKSTVTIQNADGLQAAVTNGTSTNASATTATSSAQTIASGSKANSVITTIDGTQFVNSDAWAPVTGESGAGTADRTTIKGNTITTGKVTMDYADVMKDLGVRGNANINGKTTTGSLEVTGTSTLKGDVTMGSNATVKNNLNVGGITTTKTLSVTENATVGGTLDVTGKATFKDSVDIAKDLAVGGNATITGDVTAKSYKVGDKTYISADGINANDQKITNVADGSISEGSKDAVNGGQLYGMKTDLEHKVDKVGANAAAMANLHPMEFDPDSKWNIAAAMGNYGSETATAIGAFYRPNEDVMVNFSTAFGTGENMVGGGVSVRLGKGSNKLSRQESNALKAQVNDLTARMDALLSVLNPNMSKDFPDVPENHWAYEAVSRLAGNDIVQGYPDGEFHGERTMTRYEMAEIIYNALSRGAEAEKELVEEFKPELQAMAASEKATAERAEG